MKTVPICKDMAALQKPYAGIDLTPRQVAAGIQQSFNVHFGNPPLIEPEKCGGMVDLPIPSEVEALLRNAA